MTYVSWLLGGLRQYYVHMIYTTSELVEYVASIY